MNKLWNTAFVAILAVVVVFPGACSGSDNDEIIDETPVDTPETAQEIEPVKITIGNLTDLTGVSANALVDLDAALNDVVTYYNESDLIPGVELEVIPYDTQYEPARFIPGYEWLREKGADLIWNALPPGVTTLKSRANEDQFPIFSATANVKPEELNGSYVFRLAIAPEYEAYTLLDWIANNDPDFPTDRPAIIGGAAWSEAYSDIWFEAAKAYCAAHPDQYEWEIDYLTHVKFNWETEVEGLKDCDYVYVPTPPQNFVKEYRQAGYTAKFLGTEVHAAFHGMIGKSQLWEEIDGMIFLLSAGWYTDDEPIMGLVNNILGLYHSEDEANGFRINGGAYRAVMRINHLCEIIQDAVENVGAKNFNTESLIDAAKSWTFNYEEVENFSNFTETKRFSQNYYAVFKVQVDTTNPHTWEYITRADDNWVSQVTNP